MASLLKAPNTFGIRQNNANQKFCFLPQGPVSKKVKAIHSPQKGAKQNPFPQQPCLSLYKELLAVNIFDAHGRQPFVIAKMMQATFLYMSFRGWGMPCILWC